jgi:hypothetical protein
MISILGSVFIFPSLCLIFRAMSQASFFDIEYQLDKSYQINNFLPRLDDLIDWSLFIDLLNQVRSSEKNSNTGRPAFDVLLMFKILILKT